MVDNQETREHTTTDKHFTRGDESRVFTRKQRGKRQHNTGQKSKQRGGLGLPPPPHHLWLLPFLTNLNNPKKMFLSVLDLNAWVTKNSQRWERGARRGFYRGGWCQGVIQRSGRGVIGGELEGSGVRHGHEAWLVRALTGQPGRG
jgi:hypothetical protein